MKHYLKPVHVYVTAIEHALLEIGEEICSDSGSANVLWIPFEGRYLPNTPQQKIVYCWHGGHHFKESCRLLEYTPPSKRLEINILCKKKWEADWIRSRFPEINIFNLLAKYSKDTHLFQIHKKSQSTKEYEFIFLNNNNNEEINKTIFEIETQFPHALATFGTGTNNGFVPDTEVFPKAKFTLFIKPGGYVCNSVTRSIIAGVPVIMTSKRYEEEYADHYPAFLFICGESIADGIQMARNMREVDYLKLRRANIAYADLELSKYNSIEQKNFKAFLSRLITPKTTKNTSSSDPFFDLINNPCLQNVIRVIEQQPVTLHSELAGKFLACNLAPDTKWALIAKAHLLSKIGHTAKALETLKSYSAEDVDISVATIDIHMRAKNYMDALELANLVIPKFPDHPWLKKLHKQLVEQRNSSTH